MIQWFAHVWNYSSGVVTLIFSRCCIRAGGSGVV
jgi:hypothetical protein